MVSVQGMNMHDFIHGESQSMDVHGDGCLVRVQSFNVPPHY
jgi:hypothetical protein